MTFLPSLESLTASSEENTTLPEAAPGDAGKPLPIIFLGLEGSNLGWRSCSI